MCPLVWQLLQHQYRYHCQGQGLIPIPSFVWESDLSFQIVYFYFELWTLTQEGASQLQSRKFLPLMYQLAARMSARTLATDLFQQTLQQVCVYTYACVRAIERGEKGAG